jgi:hypothetical protein
VFEPGNRSFGIITILFMKSTLIRQSGTQKPWATSALLLASSP